VRVEMIRGKIHNPLQVIGNLSQIAKASGASILEIESTIANTDLYEVLSRRYGLVSRGPTDVITLPFR
jgi:hypothetical protein